MDFKQLQKEFRKLKQEAGEKTSDVLIAIMEFKTTQFEEKLDQLDRRFKYLQWMMGIGFSAIAFDDSYVEIILKERGVFPFFLITRNDHMVSGFPFDTQRPTAITAFRPAWASLAHSG